MTTDSWTPDRETLPYDPARGTLVCPGCPRHAIGHDGPYEIVMEGYGLDGPPENYAAVRVTRRAPGLGSGPFDVPSLPAGMAAIAVIDYLERQTFAEREVARLVEMLTDRFPATIIHVWPTGPDVSHRIAEDAYWDADQDVIIRSPVVDIAPHEYPMDVGWRPWPEKVAGADGTETEIWRGCLYVNPESTKLVRYDWDGIGPLEPSHSRSAQSARR